MSKKIKKVLYVLNPVNLWAFFLASKVFAQTSSGQNVPNVTLNISDVYARFVGIMNWIFSFAIVLAVILIIVGGISYMTAGGDDTKLGTAKKRIIWGLVGAAIVICAWGLISLLSNFFNAGVIKPS